MRFALVLALGTAFCAAPALAAGAAAPAKVAAADPTVRAPGW